MKSLFNILTQNNFFRHKLLKNIFFTSLLVAIAFPLYTLYYETKRYTDGETIIDIEKSSSP